MPPITVAVLAMVAGGLLVGLAVRPRRGFIAAGLLGTVVVALAAYYLGAVTVTPPWLGWLIP